MIPPCNLLILQNNCEPRAQVQGQCGASAFYLIRQKIADAVRSL
jgi:hypothetical protein